MKILSNWMMGFVTLAVITFIGLQDPFVKETLRLKSFDLLAQYEEQELSPDIGILTIDEASIEKYGQYPWNREVACRYYLQAQTGRSWYHCDADTILRTRPTRW